MKIHRDVSLSKKFTLNFASAWNEKRLDWLRQMEAGTTHAVMCCSSVASFDDMLSCVPLKIKCDSVSVILSFSKMLL